MWYDGGMEEKITIIKKWLQTGSINIFGLPMAGKDTQGIKLAGEIGGKFLSSGMIIRALEKERQKHYTDKGELIPTDIFYDWVLPYFAREDIKQYPLVLSSIGRWKGEEDKVIEAAMAAGHEIRTAVVLNVAEAVVAERFKAVEELADRGERADDKDNVVFQKRLEEFREKTVPVLQHYKELGMLIEVNGHQTREAVFSELVERLYERALRDRA